jgi:uncharacterized membrane protein YfcA
MNKKLQEIGEKLNITEKDIQRMQKGFISKKILIVIVGVIIAILAFIMWLLWKRENEPTPLPDNGGYPFNFAPPVIMSGYLLTKKKNSKVAGFLISAIAFLSSLIAPPIFGVPPPYNVYSKR